MARHSKSLKLAMSEATRMEGIMKKQKTLPVIVALMAVLITSGCASNVSPDDTTEQANVNSQQAATGRENASPDRQAPTRNLSGNSNGRTAADAAGPQAQGPVAPDRVGNRSGSSGADNKNAQSPTDREKQQRQPADAAGSGVNKAGHAGSAAAHTSAGPELASAIFDNPVALVFGAILIILTLGLHVVHLVAQSRLRREIGSIGEGVRSLRAIQGKIKANNGNGLGELAIKFDQQRQALDRLAGQVDDIDRYLTATKDEITKTTVAAELLAHWICQIRLQDAKAKADDQISAAERTRAIQVLSRCKETAGSNVSRLKPLTQAISVLTDSMKSRLHMPPEVASRLADLENDINQFGKWYVDLNARLDLLERGSFPERYSAFEAEQKSLDARAQAGAITISEYVEECRDLLERHFPYTPADPTQATTFPEQEAELGKLMADVPDYLMDWFDKFYQLQSQAIAAQTSNGAVEIQTAAEFLKVRKTAGEILGKFDIQPEEIQVGQTSFDRRLHEAALITQAPQYPANTVIAVHRCGFRKLSTGEVLRRPKVVVAGVGAV
jgi:hypothetical protein